MASREMLTHYSRIPAEAKRKAVAALDNVTIGELEDQVRRLEKAGAKTN
jgi:hypothetical protein